MGNRDALSDWTSLTKREAQVASLFARGATYASLSKLLALSEHTVDRHLQEIYKKLRIVGIPENHRIRLREIVDEVELATSRAASAPLELLDLAGELVGREHERKQIQAALDNDECRVLVLKGMHGIGKTHLIRKCLRQHFTTDPLAGGLFRLIDCEADDEVDELSEIGGAVGISEGLDEDDDRSDGVAELARSLANASWIVLVENFERLLDTVDGSEADPKKQFDLRDRDMESLLLMLSRSPGKGKLVLTTTHAANVFAKAEPGRLRYIGREGSSIGGLGTEDGIELLRPFATGMSDQDSQILVDLYEGHPEALGWAGELLASDVASFRELLEGESLPLQARIEHLLARVYEAATASEAHVLGCLSILRRPADVDLLEALFEAAPPPNETSWRIPLEALGAKSLAQVLRGHGRSLYYLHVLVRDFVHAHSTNADSHHYAAAFAYEAQADRLWEKRNEVAQELGLESIYHFASINESDEVRRLTSRLLPALNARGRRHYIFKRYELAKESLSQQIELLGRQLAEGGDDELRRRFGLACFYRALAKRKHGELDGTVLADLESAIKDSGYWRAHLEYTDVLEMIGLEVYGDEMSGKIQGALALAHVIRAKGDYRTSGEIVLGRLGLLWQRVAPSEADRRKAFDLLQTLFVDPPSWAPPSYYETWAETCLVLGDHADRADSRRQHYEQVGDVADRGRAHYDFSVRLPIASAAASRRLAATEPPDFARTMLDEAKATLESVKANRRTLSPRLSSAIESELARISLSLNQLEADRSKRASESKRFAKWCMSRDRSSAQSSIAVSIVDDLLELADTAVAPRERDEALDQSVAVLRPLIKARTNDWRVYYRLVRVVSRRAGLEGRASPKDLDEALTALDAAPKGIHAPRLRRAKAELLRRRLGRLGWNTNPTEMHRARAAAERALREAVLLDPDDPHNQLEEALLFEAAAFASSKTEDFDDNSTRAATKFQELLQSPNVAPTAILEYALFCRRTWQYRAGYEAFKKYLSREPPRRAIWRAATLYLELIFGLVREEGHTDQTLQALADAAEIAEESIESGFGEARLLCANARVLHELGRIDDSAALFSRAFPSADDYLDGISERRAQLTADYESQGDPWARAFASAIGEPWVANSAGTYLKECRGDVLGAIRAYELGLSLARGHDQFAEAILFANLGTALMETTEPADLLRAHECLSRARDLSKGRYIHARKALDELTARPDYTRALAANQNID